MAAVCYGPNLLLKYLIAHGSIKNRECIFLMQVKQAK